MHGHISLLQCINQDAHLPLRSCLRSILQARNPSSETGILNTVFFGSRPSSNWRCASLTTSSAVLPNASIAAQVPFSKVSRWYCLHPLCLHAA
jgi:hypothetical protein